MNPHQKQQGDITLEKVETLPAGCKVIKRTQHGAILAESQVTNNRHYIPARSVNLLEAPDGTRFIAHEGDAAADLLHSKDHAPIQVDPGVHRVGNVHEMDHLTGMVGAVVD